MQRSACQAVPPGGPPGSNAPRAEPAPPRPPTQNHHASVRFSWTSARSSDSNPHEENQDPNSGTVAPPLPLCRREHKLSTAAPSWRRSQQSFTPELGQKRWRQGRLALRRGILPGSHPNSILCSWQRMTPDFDQPLGDQVPFISEPARRNLRTGRVFHLDRLPWPQRLWIGESHYADNDRADSPESNSRTRSRPGKIPLFAAFLARTPAL